jgi:hypothetical protein
MSAKWLGEHAPERRTLKGRRSNGAVILMSHPLDREAVRKLEPHHLYDEEETSIGNATARRGVLPQRHLTFPQSFVTHRYFIVGFCVF